jgi:hypothetical protein
MNNDWTVPVASLLGTTTKYSIVFAIGAATSGVSRCIIYDSGSANLTDDSGICISGSQCNAVDLYTSTDELNWTYKETIKPVNRTLYSGSNYYKTVIDLSPTYTGASMKFHAIDGPLRSARENLVNITKAILYTSGSASVITITPGSGGGSGKSKQNYYSGEAS